MNQKTKTVRLIETLIVRNQSEHEGLERLFLSFRQMELNSARRSSNDEYQVIARTTGYRLQRRGIQYDQCGTRYCDHRADFNQYFNALRSISVPI